MTWGLLAFDQFASPGRAAVVEAAGWALVHFVW
ncbi:MAG: hypothetical protein JWO31_2076, partial [Phycisphaerales bacterium]|nr:hypothetical protein [Phycisphaerales bacterium]